MTVYYAKNRCLDGGATHIGAWMAKQGKDCGYTVKLTEVLSCHDYEDEGRASVALYPSLELDKTKDLRSISKEEFVRIEQSIMAKILSRDTRLRCKS